MARSQATRETLRGRLLQYVADATVRGAAVEVDEWLLQRGADEYAHKPAGGSATVAGIVLATRRYGGKRSERGATIRPANLGEATERLIRLGVTPEARRTAFVYATEWPDADEATEDADRNLEAKAPPARPKRERNGHRKGKPRSRTEEQQQVLRHVADTLRQKDGRHWLAIDAWLVEQAAGDAKAGHGQGNGRYASRWGEHEAEFEIDGIWLRAENRRRDDVRDGNSVGLTAELRILEPRTAAARLKAMKLE